MRRPFAFLTGVFLPLAVATAQPAVSADQIATLYRPFLAEQVTLAPDGKHVAYTEHVRNELHVVIMQLEEPYAKVTLAVDNDTGLTFSKEKKHATLRFLRWATPNRLVFAPAEELVGHSGRFQPHSSPILAVDADGKNPRTLADGPDFVGTLNLPTNASDPGSASGGAEERPRFTRIVGFPVGDRDHLLVQALGAVFYVNPMAAEGLHATPIRVPVILPTTLFKVDIQTGKLTPLGDEYLDGGVGYDWQGRSRISYAKPALWAEHPFALLGTMSLKFTEAWLGPLAGHATVTPRNYFGERAFPLGFDVDPAIVYLASNVGRDTYGIYALNLKTKQRTDLALEDPHVDLAPLDPDYPSPHLIFDEVRGQLAGVRSPGPSPVSVWRDPDLAAEQRALERKFPRRTVEILEWSDARTAFLVRITGGTEPGRYFVDQQAENLPLEILRRAPWLNAADLHPTEPFAFDTAQGVHLTGYVTWPRTSRLNPPPAAIGLADDFPAAPHPEFDRQAQVLAGMGLVVIRLNHRGVGGFGRRHRDAVLAGIDRVPTDDAVAALDWIGARHPLDRKRIATLGSGFGGYLAVRAVQLRPDIFRCAVAFNAPLDAADSLRTPVNVDSQARVDFAQEANRAFVERGRTELSALSVLDRRLTTTRPVFLLVEAGASEVVETANLRYRDQLRRQGEVADYLEVNADFRAELPAARARAYARLEEFFNLNLYDYKVKVGETKEIK